MVPAPYLSGAVIKQMDLGLRKAQERYFVAAARAARGIKADNGPWLIAQQMSPALFETWTGAQESRWKLSYEERGGRVLLYGDPLPVHEDTGAFIRDAIKSAVEDAGEEIGGAVGRRAARRALVSSASPLCQLVDSKKEPDFTLRPHDQMQRVPTIVGEIAYQNESLTRLKREVIQWTTRHDLAQMCIGVKINNIPAGAAHDPFLTIVWKHQQQQIHQMAFGKGTACTSARLPQYQFEVPLGALFARSSLLSIFGQRSHVTIDLFEVRCLVHDSLQ